MSTLRTRRRIVAAPAASAPPRRKSTRVDAQPTRPSARSTSPRKDRTGKVAADVKEACILAANGVIAESGVEQLSLRDVARRLGVSHQAPYKHFANRDHLLAEVLRRYFLSFSQHLEQRARHEDPAADLESLGLTYLQFALEHPLEYRLMFSTPWPAGAGHAELEREARRAFDVLRNVMNRLHGPAGTRSGLADRDALFIWSSMHGLAGVLQSNIMPSLGLRQSVVKDAVQDIMCRISLALGR